MPAPIPDTPLPLTLVLFLAAATGVWLSGSRLVVHADEIADRMRIGRALMGFVFLATATSLPEIITTALAAGGGDSSLALGNLLGGVTLQFAMLAIADGFARHAAITSFPRKTTAVLEGVALAFLLTMLLVILEIGSGIAVFHVGIGAILLGSFYIGIIVLLRRHDEDTPWMPVRVLEAGEVSEDDSPFVSSFPELSTTALNFRFLLLTIAILVSGAVTVSMSERLAEQTGLGTGLVGVTLLAAVTSLPELSTTVAAVRIGAYSMAISNIFGSNLLMLALVLPADILYLKGPILAEFEPVLDLALVSGLLVTIIYIAGLVVRSRRTVLGFGYDSLAVLAIFAATLSLYWANR
ncbi:sodium:calcium antiporter [Oricola thermophila]|uniref:Sodium:calcium antiporter n=1 Tax=Oricola thermophila TaxID=2742145 RepID=A0A6N1VET8_9HYPH|nr:sodium:calcium antiporter [Oricola thermophila]QKV18145.1 sodium:calcium antiporter [Oricola thermophila]